MEYEVKGQYGAVSWSEQDILTAHERATCKPDKIYAGAVDFCGEICSQEKPPQREVCPIPEE